MQTTMMKVFLVISIFMTSGCGNDLPENHGRVQSILFLGQGENQPLIVALGGSEGGNAWASDRWKATRDKFVSAGYAFLALGYFGAEGTPEHLDRISIESVHRAILDAAKNSKIDHNRIALVGGSKGAELALLMASYFKDIDCVVAMVPGRCAFPALTSGASTSSWTYNGKEVPFVPAPWAAVPSMIKHDLRRAFEIMLEDKEAVGKAAIKVENINGPILLVSAKEDEMWPSTEMSNEMMKRLNAQQFKFTHEHLAVDGGHSEVLDYFDYVLSFLSKNFPSK
jgi:dienelactone hydrolase